MSVVEAMARALCVEHMKRRIARDWTCQLVSDVDRLAAEISAREWRKHIGDAKASLRAMAEPTAGMIDAGQKCEAFGGDGGQIYRAMIAKAVEEGGDG